MDCVLTAALCVAGARIAPRVASHVKSAVERVAIGAVGHTADAVLRILIDTLSPKAAGA